MTACFVKEAGGYLWSIKMKWLKNLFAQLKLKREIKKEVNKFYKENKNDTLADRFAKQTCEWVELLWNGTKQKFLIHVTNFQELLLCGWFPNAALAFVKNIGAGLDKDTLKAEDWEGIDLQRAKEEQEEFLIELAQRSMVQPSYRECYDAILKLRGMENGSEIDDVIPKDFLYNLQLWYLQRWGDTLKKNLEMLTTHESGELQNTGDAHRTNTLT